MINSFSTMIPMLFKVWLIIYNYSFYSYDFPDSALLIKNIIFCRKSKGEEKEEGRYCEIDETRYGRNEICHNGEKEDEN